MGGCGSKDGHDDEIKSDMKVTKVPAFDEYFTSASEVLSTLEDLRSTFQDTRDEMNEIARTEELVEPNFIEALRVFFWSVSAHKEGNILLAGLKFETEPPAFTVDCGTMDWVTWNFSDALKKLIGGTISAPGQLLELPGKIKDVTEKLAELSKDLDGNIKAAGLNAIDAARAGAAFATNSKTVSSGLAKAPKVLDVANAALKDIKEALPKISELISNADEVGKKAHEKKIYKIDDIFDHFQTAPKKTPEQIKAMKKDEKRKKKGKKAKKHGKDGKKDGHKHKEGHKDKDGHKEGHKGEKHHKEEKHHEHKEEKHEHKEEKHEHKEEKHEHKEGHKEEGHKEEIKA